jgi:hypothetical protein
LGKGLTVSPIKHPVAKPEEKPWNGKTKWNVSGQWNTGHKKLEKIKNGYKGWRGYTQEAKA